MPAIAKVNEDFHAVLGVDVGYSDNRISTGLCLLSWDDKKIEIVARRCTSQLEGQKQAILDIVNEKKLASVAIDGPLTHDFQLVNYYRSSETLLSRGCLQRRGKPGPTNSPTGQQLHTRATELAQFIAKKLTINNSSHYQPIYAKSVVEAFPNMFLAALIDEHHLPQLHRDASDRYWEKAIKLKLFDRMFSVLLPGRELRINLDQIADHDERAAIVCALTALVVAVGKPVGVGDPSGGDIILPPRKLWGLGNGGVAWMTKALLENMESIGASPGNVQHHDLSRIYDGKEPLQSELTHLTLDIARISSFTSFEDRLHPLIQQYVSSLFTSTNGPADVSVTRIPENNLIIEWKGNNQELQPIALTAHLDKINHFGAFDINELPVAIDGDEIVGQLDDAVGVALCLHILSECLQIKGCPPIMLLLSEMEERGSYRNTSLLKNNGQGIELSPGAHRIADYLLKENKLPGAVITFDTSAVFGKTGGIAVHSEFWEMEGSCDVDQSDQLISRTQKLVEEIRAINPSVQLANGLNDYVTYGTCLNELKGNDIPSIAIEPAIDPIHAIGERMKIADIQSVADTVIRLIKRRVRANPAPAKPYDHHDKAGNPGDVIKHVALLAAADAIMKNSRDVFRFADTFAGYAFNPIRSSGEWQEGIGIFEKLPKEPTNEAITFWHSLWSCAYGLAGSTYPGSSTFIRKLCMKRGVQAQLSLWDTSPAVISQLKQTYSDNEARIFDRPATVKDFDAEKPDLLLIDPPDLSLIASLLAFVELSDAVVIWLPVLYTNGTETAASKNAYDYCQKQGLRVTTVTWKSTRSMCGCRLAHKLPEDAAGAIEAAVGDIAHASGWKVS